MKQSARTVLILTSIAVSILAGMVTGYPIEAFGQSKGKAGPSQIRRDPFLLPPGIRLLSASELALGPKEKISKAEGKPAEPPLPPLSVKAILIGPRIRLAAVERQIVTVGDSILGEKVLEIERDRVVLGRKDKKRTLFLPQSPVQVKVEERQGEYR